MTSSRGDRATAVELDLSSPVEGHEPLDYSLRIEPRGQGYWIPARNADPGPWGADPVQHVDADNGDVRYFDVSVSNLVRPSWVLNPLETALAQVPKMFREPEELRRTIAGTTFDAVPLNVAPRSPVRLPQQMRPATLPGPQGEDLVPCLTRSVKTIPIASRSWNTYSLPHFRTSSALPSRLQPQALLRRPGRTRISSADVHASTVRRNAPLLVACNAAGQP